MIDEWAGMRERAGGWATRGKGQRQAGSRGSCLPVACGVLGRVVRRIRGQGLATCRLLVYGAFLARLLRPKDDEDPFARFMPLCASWRFSSLVCWRTTHT